MQTIRVLVADDHAGFRSTLTSFLRLQPGVEVVGEVGDGYAVVEQATALDPDLILVDVRMPRVNGIDAAREIKRLHPDTHVVVMSAGGQEMYRTMALQNRADAFFEKSSLKSSLQSLLASFRHRPQPLAA